jgi:hypothetical protein
MHLSHFFDEHPTALGMLPGAKDPGPRYRLMNFVNMELYWPNIAF